MRTQISVKSSPMILNLKSRKTFTWRSMEVMKAFQIAGKNVIWADNQKRLVYSLWLHTFTVHHHTVQDHCTSTSPSYYHRGIGFSTKSSTWRLFSSILSVSGGERCEMEEIVEREDGEEMVRRFFLQISYDQNLNTRLALAPDIHTDTGIIKIMEIFI